MLRGDPVPSFNSPELPDGIILIICAPSVLTPEELSAIHLELRVAPFVDGASTAGWSAREVKKNLQLSNGTESQARVQQIVRAAVLRNGLLQVAMMPTAMTLALFNCYEVGMQYGPHVDAPLMADLGNIVRSDIAITIFLSDPKTYTGGDLVIHTNGVENGFKLDAGAAIAYPANSLHHVTPVTEGARFGAVIWVQSQVRDASKRELLWDLESAKRQIFGREGKSMTFDAVSKSHANLLRMWADV